MAPPTLRPHQLQHILKLYKAYMRRGYSSLAACAEIAPLYGRSAAGLVTIVRHLLADTTEVAQHYMKSSALRLAMRVVRDGNVQQAMDVLERPGIGVLAPKKAAGDSSRGFFLTVSADSCGAVKASVGVIEGGSHAIQESETGAGGLRGLPGAGDEGEGEDVGLGDGPVVLAGEGQEVEGGQGVPGFSLLNEDPPHPKPWVKRERGPGKSASYQAALERARKKIEGLT